MKINTKYNISNQSFRSRIIGKVTLRQSSSKVLASAAIPFWRLRKLKQLGVTQIIDLNYDNSLRDKVKCLLERITCKLLGVKYKKIPTILGDVTKNKKMFDEIHQFISDGKKFTHIHCRYGLHRTGIVCAAEQILNGEKNLQEAIAYLEKHDYWTGMGKKITAETNPKRYKFYKKLLTEFKALFAETSPNK